MASYMRDQFAFLGISSAPRRVAYRAALVGLARPNANELASVSRTLWEMPEREYQYAACDLLAANAKSLGPEFLVVAKELVETKSWWDTVDGLAAHVVGAIVLNHRGMELEMDLWVEDPNLWVRRTAILHQLTYKSRTDTERLFGYCLARAGEPNFFIRKAIGWALREYSKTDEVAVRSFVEANAGVLSPLSQREALMFFERRERRLARKADLRADD